MQALKKTVAKNVLKESLNFIPNNLYSSSMKVRNLILVDHQVGGAGNMVAFQVLFSFA